MKPEAQRIAIAEACGIKVILTKPRAGGQPSKGVHQFLLPDYLHDLNAIRGAVLALDKTIHEPDVCLRDVFASELEELFSKDRTEPEVWSMFDLLTATPEQWSEAFLRTIGKWTED